MSTSPDPWCGLEFGEPKPRSTREAAPAPRGAIQKALASEDPVALAQALDAMPASSRRPNDLARYLAERFSPACAQVLFERNLLPARTTFDLAVDEIHAEHVAWWLSDSARVKQLFGETQSPRYQKRNPTRASGFDWLSLLLRNWADHHPREFVIVGASASWSDIQRAVSGRDRFPYFLYDRALATGRVTIDDVRPGLENALNPLTVRQLVYSSETVLSIPQAQGLALKQVRDVLLTCSPAHASTVQALVRSSSVMSKAWDEYWRLPDRQRDTKHEPLPRILARGSDSFKVVCDNLVIDQLVHAAPATVEHLAKDDMKNPSDFTRACLATLAANPNVLSAFAYKIKEKEAPHILGRLAPHLAHVRCHPEWTSFEVKPRGLSYAALCVSRHPTLNMINALARQPQTVLQLQEPGPQGRTPYEDWVSRCIPTPTARQLELVAKNIAQGKRELLSGLTQPETSDRPAPRRSL